MERVKRDKGNSNPAGINSGLSVNEMEKVVRLQAMSVILARAQWAHRVGLSYDDNRDLYEALGYPLNIQYQDYNALYNRQDIASAVINRPIEATWRGPLRLLESVEKETPLEKAWMVLEKRLQLRSKFIRLDKLVGIGQYGILFLGLNDASITKDLARPTTVKGEDVLLYVKPLGEGSATVGDWEQNTANERYGRPSSYDITLLNFDGTQSTTFRSHHSRVLHVSGGLLESEVYGVPRLQVVFNRLKDLEKLTGGSAEMFWRGARPGYQGKVDKEFQLPADFMSDLQTQFDEFEHNLRRFFVNEGLTLESLAPQVSDPSKHVDIQIQMISAATGIPKRILTGSELGELASTQDREAWLDLISYRRLEFAEALIIRPFVDKCIELGVLPEPAEDYSVDWEDLFSPSEKDKAEIGRLRAAALKDYTTNPVSETIMPPEAFFRFLLNLPEEQVKLIESMMLSAIEEEQSELVQEETPPPAVPPSEEAV